MPLFSESRCPRCDSGLPLKVLWEFSRSSSYHLITKAGLLRGRIGVVCPNCAAKLRVVQTRIRVFVSLLWAAAVGGAWCIVEWIRHAHVVLNQTSEILGFFVLFSLGFIVQQYCMPRLAQVRLAAADEQLGFPLSGADGKLLDPQDSQTSATSAASNSRCERSQVASSVDEGGNQ